MRIAIVTGCRSEWGLIEPLYKKLRKESLSTYVISAGPHNSVDHNQSEIGVYPEWMLIEIESMLSGYSKSAITKSIGMTTILAAEVMKSYNFDLVVITGDRWESFAVATAAHVARIPIMHLHAGESTFGSTDNAFRHSISHMATYLGAPNRRSLEFLNQFRDGEKYYIRLVGALGLHKIDEVESDHDDWTAVVSFHPQTIGGCGIKARDIYLSIDEVLGGDVTIFSTTQSPDVGLDPSRFGTNVIRGRYLSILKKAKFIIGNSSSGIIEAPVLGTPTINIGSRQSGRLMGQSIYQADTKEGIMSALRDIMKRKQTFEPHYNVDGVEGTFKWIMEIQRNARPNMG